MAWGVALGVCVCVCMRVSPRRTGGKDRTQKMLVKGSEGTPPVMVLPPWGSAQGPLLSTTIPPLTSCVKHPLSP